MYKLSATAINIKLTKILCHAGMEGNVKDST